MECDAGSALLADRLYLNDGGGIFTAAPPGTLPKLGDSSGVVAAGDFDRDGDLDLFVGSRVIPGQYPLAPESRLLRNDGGRFSDVTQLLAPQLQRTGLVTGAIWSDADADGWIDLLVTHEWGPVKLFANRQGRLVDRTREAGLEAWLGWWNGIAARDLDADGDIDYAVTNVGLNSRYRATPDHPTLLYYGDFDDSGTLQLVEAEFKDGKLVPIRSRAHSIQALPILQDRFPTHRSFAKASLEEVYTAACLRRANRSEANTLSSGVLINSGRGQFQFHALPILAQVAPGFGVALTEINGDGHPDLYLVHNFFGPHLEATRMDGGLSLLLQGKGDGTFEPIWPDRSGLVIAGDAKGLAVTELNGDGWPDLVVGINNGEVAAFEHQGPTDGRLQTVRLAGPPGNPTAVGARVTVDATHAPSQTAEIHAGSGYLSQSTSDLTFGLGPKGLVARVQVVWPDGSRSSHAPGEAAPIMVIRYADAERTR